MDEREGLDMSIRFVKGVGPRRADLLKEAGISTVRDLLDIYPRRYQFFGELKKVRDLVDGENASVLVRVDEISHLFHKRPPRSLAAVSDETDSCVVRWFNCRYLSGKLKPDIWMRVSGKVSFSSDGAMFTNPRTEFFETLPEEVSGSLTLPVYPAIPDIDTRNISRMVQNALADYSEFIDDWFDPIHLKKRDIPELRRSYEWIHQPENLDHWSKARRRFAYDELFFMQMGFLLSRQIRKEQSTSVRFSRTSEIDDHIRKRFPFSLTNAQNKVIEEVIADMNSNQPMYRLVQGDVGCGKTVVAVYAALVAVANKRQVAIMAPTEILAEQHYKKISRYLENSRVNVRLLTGGISSADKKNILENSAKGTIDILIGTHAIIQKNVEFARLGLVIIDEQHKFGVAQRFSIKSKGVHPHYLVMTATPIPRTMAMTIFGDLEISIIDSLPPGRIPPITRAYTYQKRNEIWEFVRKILSGGDQGFVVYPLLDPSDSLELNSAREEEKILSEKIFPEFRVALIHGKMKSDEKNKIMSDFAAKKINLLVATVVIEVGIDIPDAAVLVIEHGERFGLSQLHQLRGRIGRGGQQGYCLVLTDPKTEEARKRIRVFTSTCDGFKIAEEDLRIRGPGEFFGTAQHGLTELKVTDLIEDYPLLVQAKRDVETILKEDPALTWQKNRKLRMELKKRLGDKLKLIEAA